MKNRVLAVTCVVSLMGLVGLSGCKSDKPDSMAPAPDNGMTTQGSGAMGQNLTAPNTHQQTADMSPTTQPGPITGK